MLGRINRILKGDMEEDEEMSLPGCLPRPNLSDKEAI